jgi:prepilin-type N-terminal cleavage/methylation domain-containing protein
MRQKSSAGFTLIELSIVLVIIGLIVGGVLVGQDLIRAAEIRATISQIEKFNTATNTFRGKFNALPGDMNYSTRATFGFNTGAASTAAGGCGGASSTPTSGFGDGDGLIDTMYGPGTLSIMIGETTCYWVDLSSGVAGNLIDGGFATGNMQIAPVLGFTNLPLYFPSSKLGRGNMIYAYELGGINYFGMSNIKSFTAGGGTTSTGSMAPVQAYNIDKKVDDGYPNSGNVFAWFVTASNLTISVNSSPVAAGSCLDSTGVTTTAGQPLVAGQGVYNTAINQGQGTGCGLSFKFQ